MLLFNDAVKRDSAFFLKNSMQKSRSGACGKISSGFNALIHLCPISYRSYAPWLSLFLLNILLRAWRVNDWLLPNVDEIVLMRTMEMGFLKGCSASSAYWPAHIILRSLFFLSEWHHYRIVGALFGTLFILVMYAVARRLVSGRTAWIFCFFLSFQWYFLYISRIMEIASFIPLCIAACLYCFIRWIETGRPLFVYGIFFIGGIAANTWSPPFFYLLGAFGLWFSAAALKKKFEWKHLCGSFALAGAVLIPYLVVIIWKTNLETDVMARFSFAGASSSFVFAPNLFHFSVPLKTWTYLTTFYHENLPWQFLSIFTIFFFLAPFIMAGRAKQPALRALLEISAFQLILMLVSPVPLYLEGHFGPLYLILLLVLLGLGKNAHPGTLKYPALFMLFMSLFLSFGFTPRYLESQQGRLILWLENNVAETDMRLAISHGTLLKLEKIPAIKKLPIEYDVFHCREDETFWQDNSPGEYTFIISSFDCVMRDYIGESGYKLIREERILNMYESNLQCGIVIWRTEKDSEEKH